MNQLIANFACELAIKNLSKGKMESLSVIYNQFHKQIYAVSWAILKNHADAEDILQTTLCEIVRCAKTFQGGNAKGWILSIARNQALNLLRKNYKCISIENMEEQLAVYSPNLPDDSIQCYEILSTLSNEEREIVILKLYVGLKHKEIANLLGITSASSEKKYQRALLKLKNSYGKEIYNES